MVEASAVTMPLQARSTLSKDKNITNNGFSTVKFWRVCIYFHRAMNWAKTIMKIITVITRSEKRQHAVLHRKKEPNCSGKRSLQPTTTTADPLLLTTSENLFPRLLILLLSSSAISSVISLHISLLNTISVIDTLL